MKRFVLQECSELKIKTTDHKENMVLVGLASPRTRLVPTLFSYLIF